jgi:MFS family permease
MVIFGAGFGMVTQILMVAIQNAVSPREIGTATAAANLFRALGGSVGVAIYGAVLAAGLRHWLPLELHGRVPHGITATSIQATPSRIHTLAPQIEHGVATAVGNSLHDVFLLAAPLALAGFLIVLFLREKPLCGREHDQPQPEPKPAAGASREQLAA